MEPLPHGLLVLSSSKPLTGRTGLPTEGRFSLLELLEIQPYQRNTPTTGQGLIVPTMTCLVGTPSIEATTCMNDDKPKGTSSHDTSQETTVFASHLVFASHRSSRLPSVIPDFQDYQPPTSTTDYFLGKINQMGTHLPLLHYIPFGNQPDYSSTWTFHCHSCTPQYTRWFMPIDAKQLGNYQCQYHGSILSCTSNSVCVFIVFFCNIPNY